MTLREATPADLPAVLDFLRRHEATSMFPLSNLAEGLDAPGPYGMRLWIAGDIEGVIGLTRNGMVQVQWPGPADWGQARAVMAGAQLAGLLGPAGQVAPLVAALGLAGAPRQIETQEPGFTLDLAALIQPEGPGHLAAIGDADPATLGAWRAAYLQEVLGLPAAQAAVQGPAEVQRWRGEGHHRVLIEAGQPLAICGFNATLPDVVQVGGVYVPPELRGQGHARRAVALLLAEARARGVARAVLFAASAPAVRAYRAIGFLPSDPMDVLFFAAPQEVPPWP